MQTIWSVATTKMIQQASKLSLNLFTSLSVCSLSILSSIYLSISLLISSFSLLFHKSVPQTLVAYLFFVNTCTIYLLPRSVGAQLIINLKNRGDEIFQEAISANASEDVIEVEYQNTDGSLVTQLIDFRNVSMIFFLFFYLIQNSIH